MRKKADLPAKICVICHRPFAWRRKWAVCWDQVRYCSEKCRRTRQSATLSVQDRRL
ncbi:MAG: DUF2256 domain-containing protein [Thalassospira sp.]|nr:DUF2256 domain-containing protein [Thalassospira sp.]MDP2697724.1 DUF2256 domain-containing protein [Thalassospira sp.]